MTAVFRRWSVRAPGLPAGFLPEGLPLPLSSAVPPAPRKIRKQAPADPEPAPADPEPDPEISRLTTEVENLKKQLQAQNIKTQSVSILPGDRETVESVLATIIRPPFEHKDNNK